MSLKMHVLTAVIFSVLCFSVFVLYFENYRQAKSVSDLSGHVDVIKKSLWEYYPAGAMRYLQLAADLKNYEYLNVTDAEGEVFVSVHSESSGIFDEFFLSLGLIYTKDKTIDIYHKDQFIGKMSVRFRHDTVYIYFYVFAVFALLFSVYVLFLHILKAKKNLEIGVAERTKDLSMMVELLEKEVVVRKRAEADLIKSERRYKTLFHDSPAPLWEEDFTDVYDHLEELKLQGINNFEDYFDTHPLQVKMCSEKVKIMDVNQAAIELHGAKNKEDLLVNLDTIFTEESLDIFRKELVAIAKDMPIFESEGEVKTLAGEPRHISLKLVLLKDERESIKALIATPDITERKKSENALKRELKINSAVADISRELISDVYDIKKISEIALNYAKILTKSEHGFVSSMDPRTLKNEEHTLKDMFDEICYVSNQRVVFPAGETGDEKDNGFWENRLNTKQAFFNNSPNRYIRLKGLSKSQSPLKNYMAVPMVIGNDLLGLIILANSECEYTDQDLVSAKRIGEVFALAVHRHHYEVERVNMEQNLRQLQKNEAIGALAGGIAHDFNNILFPIVGFAELLVDDLSGDSNLQESANEILKSSLRAKDLVKQILTFSRQTEEEIKPLKPHIIIKEVIKLIRSTIPTTIEVKQNIDPDSHFIMADPTQMHQVAMNLLTNAYHAMQDTGGILTVTLRNSEALESFGSSQPLNSESYVVLTIQDTGTGMGKKTLGKIFDPYFSTKPKDKGTGLGLSVVHGIVANYNGKIYVDSLPGKGTKFEVYLPAFKSNEISEKHVVEFIEPTGNEKVLLVDDERSILNLERQMLERLGYDVVTANSSMEALNEVQSLLAQFDLVITDMTMPKMTGDQLAQKIHEIKPDLPVIICTGFSEKLTQEKNNSAGVKGVLMKPIVKSEMAQMIRKVLDENRKKQ